jgi:hypothetical protein
LHINVAPLSPEKSNLRDVDFVGVTVEAGVIVGFEGAVRSTLKSTLALELLPAWSVWLTENVCEPSLRFV